MNNRLRFLLLFGGALVVVAVFSFPLWRPLFVTTVVDEGFPGLSSEQQMAFRQLPPDKQAAFAEMLKADATMAVAMAMAATSPDNAVPTAEQAMPAATNPVILADGDFTQIDAVHGGSGRATIYQLPDSSRVLRFEDFQVTNGPDLHVILTRSAEPRKLEEVGTDYIDLGVLTGNVGNQNYNVPSEIDFSVYKGVVIYCVQYSVIFSTAGLN
jgi:Electron transfer DM13